MRVRSEQPSRPMLKCSAFLFGMLIASALSVSFGADKADPPTTWQGLTLTPSKTVDALYLKPGMSLAPYKRFMLDPVEVEFRKEWTTDPRRVSSSDRERIRSELAEAAREVFRKELEEKGGYQLVNEQAPDVLRVRAGLVNLYITAPDTGSAARTRNYVVSAGEMTLVAELRDSESGEVLAMALDRRAARETGMMQWSSKVSNASEARSMLRVWAGALRKALDSSRAT
jgi:hypothetical protein